MDFTWLGEVYGDMEILRSISGSIRYHVTTVEPSVQRKEQLNTASSPLWILCVAGPVTIWEAAKTGDI